MMRRVALLLLLVGCNTPTTLPYHQQLVVRAYLFAYQPITDVEITSTAALTASDTVGAPISDASVTLTRRGLRYALTPTDTAAGYYHYAGTDLVVAVGDTFDLLVVDGGDTATATAIVPPSPERLVLSDTVLKFNSSGGGPVSSGASLIERWSNSTRDYFYTVVTALDTSAGCIGLCGGPAFLITAPTQADSALVSFGQLHYYGRQRLTLYHVSAAYAALYTSREQDSRNLNEPATNIHGGLGIFGAFSSDSAFFVVTGG